MFTIHNDTDTAVVSVYFGGVLVARFQGTFAHSDAWNWIANPDRR